MDKTWIERHRCSTEYQAGLQNFLNFAFAHASQEGKILCPCKSCCNNKWYDLNLVKEHLTIKGWAKGYSVNKWVFHGELDVMNDPIGTSPFEGFENEGVDDMQGMLHGAFGIPTSEGGPDEYSDVPNPDAVKFYKLVKQADQELYPGCKKYNVLSFVVRLYNIKCRHRISDKAFTELLEFLKDAFPDINETLPKSFYYTKKMIEELGLGYTKIDACPNDCMLYRKDTINDSECSICQTSRWKVIEDSANSASIKHKQTPAKVLHHFPLKPRLQRLFMSEKTSSLMRWHAEGRTKDGVLRHPADSECWETLDRRYPSFGNESRNVRLGLASDGFNPFGTMTHPHSTWPVVLTTYNLPPWLCMKQPYFIMSLLIPGPTAPGNNIDVYLQPLVEELHELWVDGLCTFDASLKQNFIMRAALLWTINDFPAYANLSGWSTKGYKACPNCNVETDSLHLKASHKICYMGHRRFLDHDHIFRQDTTSFNGETELRDPPMLLSGSQLLEQIGDLTVTFGKKDDPIANREDGWKKKSIFFALPYWEHLLLRHNLDVMHIEKNICDSLVGTLLHIPNHTKDSLNARLDLLQLHIRDSLHPKGNDPSKQSLPPACYTMAPKEKDIFCNVLGKVKVPDGYAANISRCVNLKKRTLIGLKSHDYHIIMQQLLPLAVRKSLPENVAAVLIEFSTLFRELCSKVGTVDSLKKLEARMSLTLCHLEMIFLPAFFDVMVHLAIHLPMEARIAGPVHYRWMYPIERYLLTLKSYVRNRSRPEGSIAEGYIVEECLTVCTRYLHDVETKLSHPPRNYEPSGAGSRAGLSIFCRPGRSMGKSDLDLLTYADRHAMHSYLLYNCPEVVPYVREHYELTVAQFPNAHDLDINKRHRDNFPDWFKLKITKMHEEGGDCFEGDMYWLAGGPNHAVKKYKRFVVNGFRFRTIDVDKKKKTQNSGVLLNAKTTLDEDCMYYGILTDIIELDYYESRKVVLFKCKWVDGSGSAVTQDKFGITLVNYSRFITTNEPFILASQALQVFYVDDPLRKDWKVVVKILPRDLFNMTGDQGSTIDADTLLDS